MASFRAAFSRLAAQPVVSRSLSAGALLATTVSPWTQPAHCGLFGKSKAELAAEKAKADAEAAAKAAKEKSLVPAIPNVDFSMLGIDGVNGPDDVAKLIGGQVNDLIATGYPSQIGFGFISGWCTGFALKKAGKVAAMGAGSLFILLQSLAYSGYINLNYGKIETDVGSSSVCAPLWAQPARARACVCLQVTSVFDRNKDGKIDVEDAKVAFDDIMQVVGFNMPSGGGFTAGVVAGLAKG